MIWLATPESARDPKSLEAFLRLHHGSLDWVAWAEASRAFWREVERNVEYWIERRGDVIAAIFNNALDPARSDQMQWVKFYLEVLDRYAEAGERSSAAPERSFTL